MASDPEDDDLRKAETLGEGQSAFGAYRIEGRIGAGGMGTVYRATDTRLGRAVAVKVAAAPYTERFQREARAISALNHPNVCTLYDVGPNYLVMELLDGPTLAEEIRKGPIAPELAARYGAQIAAALAEAHAHGIVHRDLKPGNIVLTRHGVKVLDFGIAKMASETDLTRTDVVLGTPAYMAPEQVHGRDADSRTDLYALGLVLYEMIRGTLPVPSASLGSMLASGSAVPIAPPCEGGTRLSSRLNALIVGLLEREPDRRPQSADAVRDELLALAGPLDAPRRGRFATVGVVAVGLALAAASVWWAVRSHTASQRWPDVSEVSPITTYRGNETTPAVSADGEWVAFSWQGDPPGHPEIYVMRSDGLEQPRRLTRNGSQGTSDAFPAWSPDGRRIAFIRSRGTTAADIIVVPAEGGEERELREIRFLSFPASSWLAWTPDGAQIVFASVSLESGRSTLFLTRLSDSSVRALLAPPNGVIGDASPALSPDGRSLAFLRWSSPSTSILLVQKLGPDMTALGEPTMVPIGPDLQRPESVVWADNQRLLFISGQRIMQWEANSDPQQIYLSGSDLAGLAIAGRDANGTPRLLTAQRNAAVPRVWEIPLRGAGLADGPPRLLSGLGNESSSADYSPDGKRLVYVRRAATPELWTSDVDGSQPRQLTKLGFKGLGVPRWSPDGRYVAFFARSNIEPQIYVVDATREQADPAQVTDVVPGCNIPTWSRDERYVYCSRRIEGEMRLYRVPFENGGAGRGEMERWFEGKDAQETADGRLLYIKDDRPGLFVRSLSGDPTSNPEERLVADIRGPIAYFAPVPEGVYYRGEDALGNYQALRFFDYASGKTVDVASVQITGNVNSLSVSPDGRRLAFTQSGRAEFDLSRIEF